MRVDLALQILVLQSVHPCLTAIHPHFTDGDKHTEVIHGVTVSGRVRIYLPVLAFNQRAGEEALVEGGRRSSSWTRRASRTARRARRVPVRVQTAPGVPSRHVDTFPSAPVGQEGAHVGSRLLP